MRKFKPRLLPNLVRKPAVILAAIGGSIFYGGELAWGQQEVYLDYSNFVARLNEATDTANVDAFDAGEIATIQTNIESLLLAAFNGYQMNFSTTAPSGTYATVDFGLTAGSGSYGLADAIDFRNQVLNDTARVYTANFSDFIESSDARAVQIQEFSTALAGTAAHELGHNLGLEHRDCYGITGLGVADSGGGHGTAGAQNTKIMGTGITGLNETQRETPRLFSDLSLAKLEFGDQIVANPLSTIQEQAGGHSTFASAQSIDFQALSGPSAFDLAATVEGAVATGEEDFYSFEMLAGEFATIQIISRVLFSNNIDGTLSLFDVDGTTELVFNDDTYVSSSAVNQGGSQYSLDSSIYNFQATTSGTYYLGLGTFSSGDTGNYELFFAKTDFSAVPEPGSAVLFSTLAVGILLRRRRSVG